MRHGFIGYGNLIRALYKNIRKNEGNTFSYCSKTNLHNDIRSFPDITELIANSDVIWLGVKPRDLDEVLVKIEQATLADKIIVSAVAGKNIRYIEDYIGTKIPVVRIMTNLAIEYGSSITAFCHNGISNEKIDIIRKLLNGSGIVIDIPEENFDIFTAVFGSGPAFLLMLLDVQRVKILEMGIAKEETDRLIIELLKGTTDYFQENCMCQSINDMIAKIACKGGTTEAGIKYLADNNIGEIFENVITMAKSRSSELATPVSGHME
jgi:pyrroline-5-carboxylate reductase